MAGPARTLWRKASPRNATDEGLLPAATQTIYLSRLCRCSESAFLTRNSVETQTQQGNGQCRGRERIPNPEHEIHLSHQRGSTGAQRPRAGVSVGHTDVRHSLISAVGAHPSASDVICGGNLCASLAARRIGSSRPLLALIRYCLLCLYSQSRTAAIL